MASTRISSAAAEPFSRSATWKAFSMPRQRYANAKTLVDAMPLFDGWIEDAKASDVPELKSAAKTFERNRDGILAYWSSGGMNNAATEGFNRKTRGLLETAYGFHDYKFLRLRIFDLGEKESIKN